MGKKVCTCILQMICFPSRAAWKELGILPPLTGFVNNVLGPKRQYKMLSVLCKRLWPQDRAKSVYIKWYSFGLKIWLKAST